MVVRSKPKIIVIEDEELLLEIIDKKLNETGFDVYPCKNGETALQAMEQQKYLPDVIWLDYHLKGMDGLEFVKKLKNSKGFSNVPILVVSNSANDSTIKKLLDAGATKYILKAQNRLDDIIDVAKSQLE